MTIERLGVVKVNITRMAWEMEMDSKSLMASGTEVLELSECECNLRVSRIAELEQGLETPLVS